MGIGISRRCDFLSEEVERGVRANPKGGVSDEEGSVVRRQTEELSQR